VVQEAQKQRWVAQWCQRAADVTHQENEKHDNVDLVLKNI
jgi:hypothetical protein